MRDRFNYEIETLKQRLLDLATAADHALVGALRAFAENDETGARTLVEADSAIDAEEVGIEEECLKLMALYQPVAGDLRLLVTILKINGELERAADLASGIAARTLDPEGQPEPGGERFDFSAMLSETHRMLRQALDAFVCHRPDLARRVIASDDAVDALHAATVRDVRRRLLQYPKQAGYTLGCLSISRALERIADIATNICEDVIYLEEGQIVRHAQRLDAPENIHEQHDSDR